MFRLLHLRRRGLNLWYWWDTRHCPHPDGYRGAVLIDHGARKMYWCNSCEATWF